MKGRVAFVSSGLLSACSLTFLSAAATAADPGGHHALRSQEHAVGAAPFSWSGIYLGAQGGYSWARESIDATWGFAGGPTEHFGYGMHGAQGGGHIGFNLQQGRLVAGMEADLMGSSAAGSGTGSYGAIHAQSIDLVGTLRGRLGFAAGTSLLYVTGGLAYGRITSEQFTPSGLAPFSSNTFGKMGWTGGAGLEHALASRISLKLEYRYTDLGTLSYFNPSLQMKEAGALSTHSVIGGLSIRF